MTYLLVVSIYTILVVYNKGVHPLPFVQFEDFILLLLSLFGLLIGILTYENIIIESLVCCHISSPLSELMIVAYNLIYVFK